MRISYRWLCELLGADPGLDLVASKLTLGGLEVEHVDRVGEHLKDVVVAEVLSSRPHPTSKNPLTLVTVNAGDGPVEIVCGAPNVPAPGGRVAFAKLGARVLDKKGAFVTLEARPVAGVLSVGMLCAEDELGFGSDHGGLLILDPSLKPGTPLSALPGMVDAILELNVTPNRGDALSHRGVAREVAALLGLTWSPPKAPRPDTVSLPIRHVVSVDVRDAARCPRYVAVAMQGVTVGPSPLAVRVRLQRLGVRPINNVVDVTNLVMLETGQPLHAFDRAEIKGGHLVVRRAREGEKLLTLDASDRALDPEDLVIADNERVLALAGVMGGEHSGIRAETRDVVIECASFEPRGVRRTARRLGMHTESSHRFERGTDVTALAEVASLAASMLTSLAGASITGALVDVYPAPYQPAVIAVRPARVAALLGVEIAREDMVRSLHALGCDALWDGDALRVFTPAHRSDLAREVDVIEEVARVYGVDRVPSALPPTRGVRAGATRDWKLRRRLRESLCALGLDEAIHMVFVSAREIAAAGFEADDAIRLANPLSDERSHLRPSLLPKLIGAVSTARKRGEERVRLFELGSVFARSGEALPREDTRIGLVMAGPRDAWLARPDDVDFYDLKGVVEELVERFTNVPAQFDREGEAPPWAHPRAWARVVVGFNGTPIGAIGAVHPDVVERADLKRGMVACELDAAAFGAALRALSAKAPSRFPSSTRDVALLVQSTVPAGAILAKLKELAGPLCESVAIFDRYAGAELPSGCHSLAFALTFRAEDRTLLDGEVDAFVEAATRGAAASFGATQR